MNNKGFTLIELLAVITILAIIALITVPIITDTIEESKKSSAIRSAELYVDAVNQAIAKKNLNGDFFIEEGWYDINSDGNVILSNETLEVKAKSKPTGGRIYIKGHGITNAENILFNTYKVSQDASGSYVIVDDNENQNEHQNHTTVAGCIVDGNIEDGNASVTCGNDKFHILSYDDNTVTLFSDYNITNNLSNPEQTRESIGITFSEEVYWMTNCTDLGENNGASCDEWNSYYTNDYVYDENSNLYPYIEAYKNKLISLGINVKEAKIPDNSHIDSIEKVLIDIRLKTQYGFAVSTIPSQSIADKVDQINSMSQEEFREYTQQFELIRLYPMFYDFPIEDQAKLLFLLENATAEQKEAAKSLIYWYPEWVTNNSYWLGNASNTNVYSYNYIDEELGSVGCVSHNLTGFHIGIRPVIVLNR